MQKKERYSKIIEWFKENMPAAESELHHRNAYELIVAVILSAQCTDKRVNMVTPALFEAYPDAQSLANANVEDILRHIKSISYPNSKAAHLSGMAKKLISDFGGEVPDDVTLLQTLPGVGRKTANVVAAVMYGKSVMPVDTHVFRVSERIGFTTNLKTPLATEKELTAHIPAELLPIAHHWLILHGRYVCTARAPKCNKCGIAQWCRHFGRKNKQETTTKPSRNTR